MVDFSYDEKNDVLYVRFADKKNSVGDEIVDRLVIHKDLDTGIVTGITIMDWKKSLTRVQGGSGTPFSHCCKCCTSQYQSGGRG